MNTIDVLAIRQKLGISQKELAKKCGVHWRTVQNWEKNPDTISAATAQLLCSLVENFEPTTHPKEQSIFELNGENVDVRFTTLLVPIAAQGGTLNDFTDGTNLWNCERIISPILGVDFAITVNGDSMDPEYPSGSCVLVKRIMDKIFIQWGCVHVLDTVNGIVIKKLMPSELDGYVCCESLNPKYPPFDVPFDAIFGIYRVMMVLTRK